MLDGDPSLVFALYARLPLDSMTRAQERGGDEWASFMGVDASYYLLAGIYDAVNVNTAATGWYKKGKAPKFEPWAVPERVAQVERDRREKATVRGLFASLGGQLAAAPRAKSGGPVWVPVN